MLVPGRGGGGGGGGLEGIIEACPGWRAHRSLSRGVEQNRSLSRGHLQVCPGWVRTAVCNYCHL